MNKMYTFKHKSNTVQVQFSI